MDPMGQIYTKVIRFTVQLFVFELPGPHVEYHETDVSSATQKLHNKSVLQDVLKHRSVFWKILAILYSQNRY